MTTRLRAILTAATALALASCGGGNERAAPEEGPRPVVPFEVEMSENARSIQAVGTARARAAATVRAEVSGIVDEVLFEAGDFVEKGDPLIQLEADDEELALSLAEVSVREAEQLLARYRRIEDTGAVSDSTIDDAKTQLEAARISRDQAQLRLADRTVRAPFAGFVGLTDLDPGARIGQDTAITNIDDRRVLFIDFSVPEDVFGQLSPGETVQATPFSEGTRPREAVISVLDSRVNPDSRAFRVRSTVDNSDDSLRPGMSFEVRFAIRGKSYPTVPEAAIVWGSDGAYLWAVRDGEAQEIPVQIVSRSEGRVLVEGDLDGGDLIIAEGVQKVREGTPVTFGDRPAIGASGISAGALGE